MGEYHFSAELARQYGLDEAIMLHNLAYWMRKNALDGRNIHDGQVWTFSSLEAFTEWFPFWSVKQIRRILASLEQQALIRKGNYNNRATDRTTWYTITAQDVLGYYGISNVEVSAQTDNPIRPNGQTALPERADDSAHTGAALPKNKHKEKTKETHSAGASVRQRDQFDQFWAAYPRKEGKKKAWEKWQKLDPDPALFAAILSGLDAHIRSEQWRRGVIPHPTTWLNGERWEDELTPPPSPDRGRVEEGGCEYV